MVRTLRRFAALAAAAVLTALPASAAEVRVVASLPDLAALARAVGGERAQVISLAVPTQDPHFVDARPSLMVELNKADLLVVAGLSLETGWLPTLQTGARNPRILTGARGYLDASTVVSKLEVSQAPQDRSQGDIHPGGNPHFLLDPREALKVARALSERLSELDPKGAAAYAQNLARFTQELGAARAGWEKRLAGLKGMPVITYHKSLVYLADWLGFEQVGFVEPKPGIPPNPAHVAKLLGTGRARKVRLVLQEEYYRANESRLLSERLPAKLVLLPGGADVRQGEGYVQRMERTVKLLEGGLGGAP